MNIIFIPLALSFIGLFALSLTLCKRGKFYTDTPLFIPLGIFVWGDALILAPFWCVVSLGLAFLTPIDALRFYLLFWVFRNGYEVIYWIGHQYAKSSYVAPLFRKHIWLKPNDSAILYQVLAMCGTVISAFLLMLSYK